MSQNRIISYHLPSWFSEKIPTLRLSRDLVRTVHACKMLGAYISSPTVANSICLCRSKVFFCPSTLKNSTELSCTSVIRCMRPHTSNRALITWEQDGHSNMSSLHFSSKKKQNNILTNSSWCLNSDSKSAQKKREKGMKTKRLEQMFVKGFKCFPGALWTGHEK